MRPFEQVVAEHGPTVLRVCRAVLGDTEAEDAWSETFLAALRAYPGLDETANVEAWLVTIAHRKALDVVRARARRPLAVADPPDRPSATGLPGEAEPMGEGDPMWEAVRALPHRQRTVVAYRYLAGLRYQEIAEITGGSADAARKAASDGIRALRARYPQRAGQAAQEGAGR